MKKGGRAGLILLLTIVWVVAGIAYLNLRIIANATNRQLHTWAVLSALNDVLASMEDMETGQRGYVISGDELFLEPYRLAVEVIHPRMARVRQLTSDNPAQQALVTALQRDAEEWMTLNETIVRTRRTQGLEPARQLITIGRDKRKMDSVRAQVAAMQHMETSLLTARQVAAARNFALTMLAIGLGAVLGTGLVLLAWRLFRRDVHAERRLAHSHFERMQWYRTTLASIGDAVIATDTSQCITFMNPIAEALTGWSEDEVRGRPLAEIFSIVHEQTGAAVDNPVSKVLASGAIEVLANHTTLFDRAGDSRPIEDSAAPIEGHDGERLGVVLVFRDVSGPRAAERALSESEDRYRSLVEATSQIVWTTDAAGRVSQDSTSWRAFTGQSYAQFEGWGWLEAIHPADRTRTSDCWERALKDKVLYEIEYRLRRHDGAYRFMQARGVPVLLPDGQVREWVGMNVDITDRRSAEVALRESEERFRQVAEMACEWIWEQEPSGRYVYSNQHARTLLGYETHEILGRHYSELQSPQQSPDARAVFPQGGKITNRYFRLINYYRHKSGREIITESTGEPVTDQEGKIIKWRGVDFDVTQRIAADAFRSRLAAIVESSNDAIIGKMMTGAISSWNAAAERIFGYRAEEVMGQSMQLLCPPDRQHEIEDNLIKLRRGENVPHYETVRRKKHGELITVSITVSPIRDNKGLVVGASETTRDITERRQAEQDREALLEATQKAREQAEIATRAKDEFLALVSHELRTPLNAMFGWARVLQGQPQPQQDVLAKAIDALNRNIDIQRQLIDDLLDSARIVSGKLKIESLPVDLVPVIEAALDVVRPAAKAKSIHLFAELPASLGQIAGDATRLQQVFWNLLANAVKFTPKGGQVSVRLERFETYARVSISDTGKGIPIEFLPYVFDRYAQANDDHTHFRHGGLGLGLALVSNLVELHGGRVSAESSGTGKGAQFIIDLPLRALLSAEASSLPVLLNAAETPVISGSRILIVDDQESARLLLSDVLVSHGCEVTTMGNGKEAFTYLQQNVGPAVDLLISDIGLPDEDGYAMMRNIRALEQQFSRVPVAAVALTAYARPEDRILALRSGFQMHLAKPVDPAELIVVIATLLKEKKS